MKRWKKMQHYAGDRKFLRQVGTAGILIMAQQQGLISHVMPSIVELRKQGYWFSDEFMVFMQRLTGESA